MGVTVSTESLLPLPAVCCCHLVVLSVTDNNSWLLRNHRIASISLLWQDYMNSYVDYKLQILLQELVTIGDRITGNGGCYKQKKRLKLNCILTTRGTTGISTTVIFFFSCEFSVNIGKPLILSLMPGWLPSLYGGLESSLVWNLRDKISQSFIVPRNCELFVANTLELRRKSWAPFPEKSGRPITRTFVSRLCGVDNIMKHKREFRELIMPTFQLQ